ncbi:715_t:CDS:1, partial [Funneliformis mosseae]
LTLPEVSLFLDHQIFFSGQAYVALSQCSNWSKVHIALLHPSAIFTDESMLKEYDRLEQKAAIPLPL